jgi:crotonobetainyl-CoA hydratase
MVDELPALLTRDGHVAVITLNRPDVRNAVDAAMATALGDLLAQADADRDVRAIVLTGAGDVSFCAGVDLKAAATGHKPFAYGHPEWGFAGFVQHELATPMIAAVNGFALGGGTELALMCDLVVASERATFGMPEVKRGIIAGAGGLVRLPRQVPLKIAMQLVLTGEPLSAHEALRWGLINEVVAHEKTLTAAVELGSRIAENAPLAVKESKRVLLGVVDGARPDEALAWALCAHARHVVAGSVDAREGMQAFIEKRAPQWQHE